jgi:type II secretory pathway pseudopilin PulG
MKKNKQAFTIVETLVTLLAITIMILGPLTFLYRSYHYAEFTKSKMISYGLAQEGLELATSLRNYNLSDFQTVADNCSAGCMADWDGVSNSPTFTPCSEESCRLYNASTTVAGQFYSSSGSAETEQYRYVKFVKNGNQSYTVDSVAWANVENTKVQVDLKKIIFNIVTK